MAAKILLGKSTNTNLHSGTKYGMWIARAGEEDVTTCAADELIFNTDTMGSVSGAIDAGQYQVMPSSGTTADVQVTVSAGATATFSFTDLDIDLIWAASFGGALAGTNNANPTTQLMNAQGYATNQSSVSVSNTGATARTGRVAAIRAFKTGGLW